MKLVFKLVITTLAVLITAYLLPGVTVQGFLTALVFAAILGLINVLIRPVLILLTLPLNILTLGLFTLVINALLIMLASGLVPGFDIGNFGWAFMFSLVLSVVNFVLQKVFATGR